MLNPGKMNSHIQKNDVKVNYSSNELYWKSLKNKPFNQEQGSLKVQKP